MAHMGVFGSFTSPCSNPSRRKHKEGPKYHESPKPVAILQRSDERDEKINDPRDRQDVELPMKASATQPKTGRKPPNKRPSFQEQLRSIALNAENLSEKLSDQFLRTREKPLLTIPTLRLEAGNTTSKYPSPVSFFEDRCEYIFHHPFAAKIIVMQMFYDDMKAVSVSPKCFYFTVSRPLKEIESGRACPKQLECHLACESAAKRIHQLFVARHKHHVFKGISSKASNQLQASDKRITK